MNQIKSQYPNIILLLLFITSSLVYSQTATGFVFEDLNKNGKKDLNEKGISEVSVSNGVEVVQTDTEVIDRTYAVTLRRLDETQERSVLKVERVRGLTNWRNNRSQCGRQAELRVEGGRARQVRDAHIDVIDVAGASAQRRGGHLSGERRAGHDQ